MRHCHRRAVVPPGDASRLTKFRKPTASPTCPGPNGNSRTPGMPGLGQKSSSTGGRKSPRSECAIRPSTEKRRQYELVEQFCERITKNPDGSLRGGVTPYETPTAFKERLATDLKHLLRERLGERDTEPGAAVVPVWTGSPYPGLRPFDVTEKRPSSSVAGARSMP